MTETKIAALIPIGRPAPALAQRAGTPYARHSRRHLRYGGATPDAAASAHVVPCGAGVGRGAATRTGTAYAREHFGDHTLVTADADGAHKGDEIMRVAGIARENPGTLVLGARVWAQAARRGRNQLRLPRVRQAARARYDGGAARGIFSLFDFLLEIPGRRGDYEMNVLLECAKRKIPTRETAICAVYPAGGAGTLFSAFVYYLRAYGNVIKFSLSSLAGFATDYALFNLFLALTPGMGEMSLDFSNYAARAVSASVNYAINRRLVFKNDDRVLKTAVQYFALAALISVGNTALLEVLTETVRLGAQIAKLLTELAFFLASFVVQRFVIFRKQKKRAKPFE